MINKESMKFSALGEENDSTQVFGRRTTISEEDIMQDLFGNDAMKPISLK